MCQHPGWKIASKLRKNLGYLKKAKNFKSPILGFILFQFLYRLHLISHFNRNLLDAASIITVSDRDNLEYPKNLGSPWICPRSIFTKIFNGIVFGSSDEV